jgi:hypothetical protein
MKRYYRHDADSDFGVGTAYLEIEGEWPTRQVEVYGQTWLWGDAAHPEHLADQPLETLDLTDEDEIGSKEFDRVWAEALRRCPPSS